MPRVASKFRIPSLILASVMMTFATHASAQVTGISGDCSEYSFIEDFGENTLTNPDGKSVYSVREGAPMYDAAAGGKVVREAAFSESLKVVEVMTRQEMPTERVRVEIPTLSRKDQGNFWMSRQELLCRSTPLRDSKTNLERKALVRTQTKEREDGVIQAITAYRTPDLSDTQVDDSRRLSRFQTYMIYAESEKAFLLGELFTMTTVNDKLVGWVNKSDVLNWNWAIGLRPPLDLVNSDGSPGSICGYESPTDRSVCIPILGGDTWFKSDQRLPVIEVGDDYYHVVGAASGLGGGEIRDGKMVLTKEMLEKLKISPSDVDNAIHSEKLEAFNKVDVFFLIDGTKSMAPYIDAIRGSEGHPGVVENIVNAIDARGGGVTVRAGFQVFRDSIKDGRSGIDESFDLDDNNCNDEDMDGRTQDRERFQQRLRDIQTTTDDKDDYDENLFGGLQQAATSMQGCPDRQKLLFVISDAGYDPDMQRLRGQEAISRQDVVGQLLDNEKLSTFFIRPPEQERGNFSSDKSYSLYRESWAEFDTLGREIAGDILARDNASEEVGEYVFKLDAGAGAPKELFDKISTKVGAVSRADMINEILIDLRGGAALAHVIQRLQRENVDVPILYFNMIKRTVCKDNEAACNQRIYDGVVDLYVPKDQPHTLDAWLKADQIDDWGRLISPIVRGADMNLTQQRKALGQIVINALQDVLNIPPPEKLDEDIGTFLSRSGRLPGPVLTPFLKYSFADLGDPEKVSSCELDRLKVWLKASKAMLASARNNLLSRYDTEVPEVDCPDLTPQGKELKYIPEEPEGIPPSKDPAARLGKQYLGAMIFWVPLEYLP